MSNFYTADLHFGHEKIIELCGRPFFSTEDMNREMLWRWNSLVDPGDNVYIIGDLAMGKIADSLRCVEKLNGNKYLIPGNHDRCWSGNPKIRPQDTEMYESVGVTILQGDFVNANGWRLCHFPYAGDSHEDDRYVDFRPKPRDESVLIHGHVHEKWRINGKQINVGVDAWQFFPVHENSIYNLIASVRESA